MRGARGPTSEVKQLSISVDACVARRAAGVLVHVPTSYGALPVARQPSMSSTDDGPGGTMPRQTTQRPVHCSQGALERHWQVKTMPLYASPSLSPSKVKQLSIRP